MKFKPFIATTLAILLTLTLPGSGAQGESPKVSSQTAHHQGPRYKLFDLGTVGGPRSTFAFGAPILNDQDQAAGFSDSEGLVTNVDLGFACVDTFLSHAFVWHDGHFKLLPELSDLGCSLPVGMNERGEIVGISEIATIDPFNGLNEDRAVIWRDGQVQDLGTLGGNQSIGTAINKYGDAAGWAENNVPDDLSLLGGRQTRAFFRHNGMMLDLGTLGGPDAVANFLNNSGQVVGASYVDQNVNPVTNFPAVEPFLWHRGVMQSLGSLGGTFGEALFINERGQVSGDSDLAGDLVSHPFFWEHGKLTDLTTSSAGGKVLAANWLTDHGEVVGAADFTAAGGPAFGGALWHNGVVVNIDTEDSACGVEAWGANEIGQVVGTAKCSGESHAWLWSRGHAIDLNTLVRANAPLHLVYALMVNNEGVIVGIGVPHGVSDDDALTQGHAFVLAPRDFRHHDDLVVAQEHEASGVLTRALAAHDAAPTQADMMELHAQLQKKLHPFTLRNWRARRAAAIDSGMARAVDQPRRPL